MPMIDVYAAAGSLTIRLTLAGTWASGGCAGIATSGLAGTIHIERKAT
jgi:hypothetical protein